MVSAKQIAVKIIPAKIANEFVRKHHYSGKVVQNSSLHFGVFLNKVLHGVMQFGSPLDKRKVLGLVKNTLWNEMLELNRMAFDDALPKNSESRAIAIAVRLIKKNAPQIKWVLSFADATQCGDGTIYRASGFVLTGIKKNENTVLLPSGDVIHKMTLESSPMAKRPELDNQSYFEATEGKYDFRRYAQMLGGKILPGYQLRYILLIDRTAELTVPVIPFGDIAKMGAGMYKGQKRVVSIDADASDIQPEEGGAIPTTTLQPNQTIEINGN